MPRAHAHTIAWYNIGARATLVGWAWSCANMHIDTTHTHAATRKHANTYTTTATHIIARNILTRNNNTYMKTFTTTTTSSITLTNNMTTYDHGNNNSVYSNCNMANKTIRVSVAPLRILGLTMCGHTHTHNMTTHKHMVNACTLAMSNTRTSWNANTKTSHMYVYMYIMIMLRPRMHMLIL